MGFISAFLGVSLDSLATLPNVFKSTRVQKKVKQADPHVEGTSGFLNSYNRWLAWITAASPVSTTPLPTPGPMDIIAQFHPSLW